MAFGIGAGIFFGHLPSCESERRTRYHLPHLARAIFSRVCKRLGVKMESRKFSTPEKAQMALDDVIGKGIPVGMQSSVYYLPYFLLPTGSTSMHTTLVVFGKEGRDYLVSDPVMDTVTKIDPESLAQARFAKRFPGT